MSKQNVNTGWGTAVWALYGVFVVFVLALVVFASVQSMDLVEPDYYQKGQRYQQRIDRMNRVRNLETSPKILYERLQQHITVTFPTSDAAVPGGTITLFRPSDAGKDVVVPIQTDEMSRQYVSTASLARGLWRVKVEWRLGDADYYHENVVFVN